jgi:hypothetical protein
MLAIISTGALQNSEGESTTTGSKSTATVEKKRWGSGSQKQAQLMQSREPSISPLPNRLESQMSRQKGPSVSSESFQSHPSVKAGQFPWLSKGERQHGLEHQGPIGGGGSGEIHKVQFPAFSTD